MNSSIPFSNGETLQTFRRRIARRLVRFAFGGGRNAASSAQLPLFGIHRILVCRISHTLGNTLLLTPLLRELESIDPGAEVDVVTRSPVADKIFGNFRCVRRIYVLPRHGLATPWKLWRIVRALRSQTYDLAIDPCVSSQSDRIGVLAAKATRKLGYVAAGKSGMLNYGVAAPPMLRHAGQVPVNLLRTATGQAAAAPYPPLDVCLTESERAFGAQLVAELVASNVECKPVVIGLFTSATGTKRLSAEWWWAFAEHLASRASDARIVEIVPVSGASLLGENVPSFYSSDLRRLACVLSGLSLFISADCGVMHLACASGTPTVGLFSVTDANVWGPYGSRDAVIDIGARTAEQVADAVPLPEKT
jgi:ADP-heptose:LPS heptosyltransferase